MEGGQGSVVGGVGEVVRVRQRERVSRSEPSRPEWCSSSTLCGSSSALFAVLEVEPLGMRLADLDRFCAGNREVGVRTLQRLVQAREHVGRAVAEGDVVVRRRPRIQPEPELHRCSTLEHEHRVVVLVADAVEDGGDDHERDPALRAGNRAAGVLHVVVDPLVQDPNAVRRAALGGRHRATPPLGAAGSARGRRGGGGRDPGRSRSPVR